MRMIVANLNANMTVYEGRAEADHLQRHGVTEEWSKESGSLLNMMVYGKNNAKYGDSMERATLIRQRQYLFQCIHLDM